MEENEGIVTAFRALGDHVARLERELRVERMQNKRLSDKLDEVKDFIEAHKGAGAVKAQ